MSYLQSAFDAVCKNAIRPEQWYVSLLEIVPYYGGPEEGGWWGEDSHLVAFEQYPTEELARAAADKVRELAVELAATEQREHGEQCLRELDWLEARGLEADWLPEPDGPSRYTVSVTQDEIPQGHRGVRGYE